MEKWEFCKGVNIYRKILIPTIVYENLDTREYICLEFWKWYIGLVKWFEE